MDKISPKSGGEKNQQNRYKEKPHVLISHQTLANEKKGKS